MRDAHSASSAALGWRCRRAWAYRYLDGLRDAEIPWLAIEAGAECTPRQRAASLGKAAHATLERWYGGGSGGAGSEVPGAGEPGAPNWNWLPGQVASAGVGLLPHPEQCALVQTEQSIGTAIGVRRDGRPLVALKVHGVRFAGFRDLLARPLPAECKRLEVPNTLLLIDHKTTSSIAQWSKSAAELERDVQANLYALDVLEWAERTAGIEALHDMLFCRWVYYETKRSRRAAAVDFSVTRSRALDILDPVAELCRELDQLERSSDAPMNLDACEDYGGCPFHKDAGGPCTARRVGAALIRARTRGTTMPIPADLAAKFQAAEAAAAAKAPASPAAPVSPASPASLAAPGKPPSPAAAAKAAAKAPRKRRGRPSKKAAAEAAAAATTIDGPEADVAALLELQTALRDAQAVLAEAEPVAAEAIAAATAATDAADAARATVADIVARIRVACGA